MLISEHSAIYIIALARHTTQTVQEREGGALRREVCDLSCCSWASASKLHASKGARARLRDQFHCAVCVHDTSCILHHHSHDHIHKRMGAYACLSAMSFSSVARDSAAVAESMSCWCVSCITHQSATNIGRTSFLASTTM